jgi:hypothetical protein
MHLISAALLSAAANVPMLAHATTILQDPADAAASVPTIAVPSAFDGYHPYRDSDNPSWRQLNQAVRDQPMAHGGMKHGGGMSMPGGAHDAKSSGHGEAKP